MLGGPLLNQMFNLSTLERGVVSKKCDFKFALWVDILATSCESDCRRRPENPFASKWTVVRVMTWCSQATSLYLNHGRVDPLSWNHIMMVSPDHNKLTHYSDVIMTSMATQITSLTIVYSAVYSSADQRKRQSSASLAFVRGIHRDRWIPRTKGQLRGKCFHLMTSSWTRKEWRLSRASVSILVLKLRGYSTKP